MLTVMRVGLDANTILFEVVHDVVRRVVFDIPDAIIREQYVRNRYGLANVGEGLASYDVESGLKFVFRFGEFLVNYSNNIVLVVGIIENRRRR